MSPRLRTKMLGTITTEDASSFELVIHCIAISRGMIFDATVFTERIVEHDRTKRRASHNLITRSLHAMGARHICKRTIVRSQLRQGNLHCQLRSRTWEVDVPVVLL